MFFRHKSRQTSETFDAKEPADRFLDAVNTVGPEVAIRGFGRDLRDNARPKKPGGPTVAECVANHIDGLSGIAKSTEYDYRAYLRNDVTPALGAIPIAALTRADIAGWINAMHRAGSSGKTIANKHALLSAALNGAVAAGHIAANPAAGVGIPRSERQEMVFLTGDEYQQLKAGFTAHWHPMLDFLVASGVRFGEAAALRPGDVDRARTTVFIGRSMKRTYDSSGYEVGPTKTVRSVRTISVDKDVLDALDYSHDSLFTNTKGTAVRIATWRSNVWYPSVARAQDKYGLAKQPRIHDLRHTYVTWMIAAGIQLEVIQDLLGHDSIDTTRRIYGHLDRRQFDQAAAAAGAVLRPQGQS